MFKRLEKLSSLLAAQVVENGAVFLWGDYGGHTFAIIRANEIRCDEAALQRLSFGLSRSVYDWDVTGTYGVDYFQVKPWEEWAEDQVDERVWLPPSILKHDLRPLIEQVLDASISALPNT